MCAIWFRLFDKRTLAYLCGKRELKMKPIWQDVEGW